LTFDISGLITQSVKVEKKSVKRRLRRRVCITQSVKVETKSKAEKKGVRRKVGRVEVVSPFAVETFDKAGT
jgi:hypothetical protein